VVAFGGDFYGALLIKLLYDCLQFVGPNLLDAIITFLNDYSEGLPGATPGVGFGYVALLFVVSVLATAFLHQYFLRVFRVGQNLRSAVVISVFRKSLLLSVGARQSAKVGRIVNLLSTDATRMQDLTTYLAMIVSGPFQMALSLYFLWKQIGPSVLAGVAVMVCFIPLNLYVARLQKQLQQELMQRKDRRVDSTNEAIQGIKLIKLSAWESDFEHRIAEQRERELSQLQTYLLLQAITNVLWNGLPLIVALAAFTAYTLTHGELTAQKAFVSLSLFNILRFPLSQLPMVISNIVEASVTLARFHTFLVADEIDPDARKALPAVTPPGLYEGDREGSSQFGGSSTDSDEEGANQSDVAISNAASESQPASATGD